MSKKIYKQFAEYIQSIETDIKTELVYKDAYQLIIAIILSAQCTDKRVNIITPNLFAKYPDFASLNKATVEQIFQFIRSCSYPNNKSKHIKELTSIIIEQYKGKIPDDFEKLTELPGIGRKTANVFLSVMHDQPTMPVDTHVNRLAKRIGLAKGSDSVLKVEQTLTKCLPPEVLNKTHHWLVLHGRYVCKARKPLCENCEIKSFCKYFKTKYANEL